MEPKCRFRCFVTRGRSWWRRFIRDGRSRRVRKKIIAYQQHDDWPRQAECVNVSGQCPTAETGQCRAPSLRGTRTRSLATAPISCAFDPDQCTVHAEV